MVKIYFKDIHRYIYNDTINRQYYNFFNNKIDQNRCSIKETHRKSLNKQCIKRRRQRKRGN